MKKIGFICICLAFLLLLQALLVPKYTGKQKDGGLTGEYYSYAGNNDVIFIGDCEVYENFSPLTMWEEYGITSCIRGSPQQTIWQSYYLLEETLRYETPKAVVFNVLSMKYDTPESTGSQERREAYNRMTLDTMRWSKSKWDAIYASMTQDERDGDGIWSYIFPLLRYHSRWSELGMEDVENLFSRQPLSHNGYLMQTGIKPVSGQFQEPPLADYRFGENSYEYLDKMTALCKEKGVELILIKAPSLSPLWWEEWDAQMASYAAENELRYINFLSCQEEIGIDWNTDTYDGGLHLNVFGAEKLSRYFGALLHSELGIPDHRADDELSTVWNEKLQRYNKEKAALLGGTE